MSRPVCWLDLLASVVMAALALAGWAQEEPAAVQPVTESPAPAAPEAIAGTNIAPAPLPAMPPPKPTVVTPLDSNVYEISTADNGLPAAESAEIKEMANGNTNLISIAFEGVPVPDVVNMFSRISGANIIVAGNFTNINVTANLKNVEWKTALNLALGSVNLAMIEDPSGILMVVNSEMYAKKLQEIESTKPLITRTMRVRYLNPVDLIEQIKLLKILSPRGTIITSQSKSQDQASLKSSSLSTEIIQNPSVTTDVIVTDIKEYVDKIELLIQQLDKREPQVFIEARIIDVTVGDSQKLGFDWEMLDRFGATAKLQDLKWSYADTHSVENRQVNKDSQYDKRSNLDGLNKRYNIDGQQYEESVTSYEESPPGSGNWVARTVVTPTRTIADTINRGRDLTADKVDTTVDTLNEAKMGTILMSVSEVSLFLSALKKTANADIISHPLLIVGNKVEAKIHIGQRYPTISSQKQSANPQGGVPSDSYSETVEWNDLGLTLWVIPEIDYRRDMIRMTVNPQMSTWVKDITTAAGSVYPVISTRQVSTRVIVPNGQTVVIGGLIESRKSNKEKRVWLLGDIPLLGLLFRYNETVNEKSNLLIMLSPTILDEHLPVTGMEVIAQQSIDRLEKVPVPPQKGGLTNAPASVSIAGQTPNTGVVAPPPPPTSPVKTPSKP